VALQFVRRVGGHSGALPKMRLVIHVEGTQGDRLGVSGITRTHNFAPPNSLALQQLFHTTKMHHSTPKKAKILGVIEYLEHKGISYP
jgi:hypothetical protein